MKKSAGPLVLSLLVFITGGCASLTHYTAPIDLANRSYSLDVKQRVVFSHVRPGDQNNKRVICAEPSPDALTVISASAGLGVANALAASANRANERTNSSTSTSANQTVNVSAALAEQGAFVGLRTQSIQLLRDTMYRLCEGYAAGAITDTEFTSMQRRYQSTMMGLLAIEQLTRPVVAAQVVLASNARAQSGAPSGDAAVDKAQERLDQKIKDEIQAKSDLDKAKTQEAEATQNVQGNLTQAKSARDTAIKDTAGDAAAKKAAGDTAAKPFDDARPALLRLQAEARTKVLSETLRVTEASQSRRTAEADLNAVKARVAAAASGDGRMAAFRDASAQMTSDLTAGVTSIVVEINKAYLRDGCFALFASELKAKLEPVLATAVNTCVSILQSEDARIREETMQLKERRGAQ